MPADKTIGIDRFPKSSGGDIIRVKTSTRLILHDINTIDCSFVRHDFHKSKLTYRVNRTKCVVHKHRIESITIIE